MSAVPGSPKVTRCTLEAGGFQDDFEHAERAGIGRGDRGAAEQIAGDGESGEGIGHAPA